MKAAAAVSIAAVLQTAETGRNFQANTSKSSASAIIIDHKKK